MIKLPPSFITQLTILQQEGYSLTRFLSWWFHHPFTYTVTTKKTLVFTAKTKNLIRISLALLAILTIISFYLKILFLTLIPPIIFLLEPFVFLSLSILIITPYEKINRRRVVGVVRKEILSHKNLTTIGITGSYGKTSVKDFLYTLLSGYQETLKTPESYNTVFGIAKVVNLELLSKTRFFICEMGAYIRGEITELCRMVPPEYAILTAIGTQHLERFKSLTNTTQAKFELVDATSKSRALVNLDNLFIAENLKQSRYRKVRTYSLRNPHADFFVSQYTLSPQGTSFTLVHQGKSYSFKSSLFGTSNLYNLTAAISMSLMLKVPLDIITGRLQFIKPSPHRLELKKINRATLIDNAFSSNEEGFTAIIGDLQKLPGKKVLITPGIIELGLKTVQVHQNLGSLSASVFDKFILVGKSLRTLSFQQGLSSSSRQSHNASSSRKRESVSVFYIPNSTNLWPIIDELSREFDWILLENDLPDSF